MGNGEIMNSLELKDIRANLGLTQAELAHELGITRRTIQYWEAGQHPISKMAEKCLKEVLYAATGEIN